MTLQQAQKRITALKNTLLKASYEYYVLNQSTMTDQEFDSLKRELQNLEQQFPQCITPDSPTQRVGGSVESAFEKVEHAKPMLSIEDIFEKNELLEWEVFLKKMLPEQNILYFCETKIDGLAIALRYNGKEFERAITRGDGTQGEDVTHNVKTIQSVPLLLGVHSQTSIQNVDVDNMLARQSLEVRGEIYITHNNFEELNKQRKKQGEILFANPRNLAAGSIRQLDPALAASRPLSFRAYDVVISNESNAPMRHSHKHQLLNMLGFPTDPNAQVCGSIEQVYTYWQGVEKNRGAIQTPIDGIVVRVDDVALFNELGATGKSPRGIRALKFTPQNATTKVKEIITQVGRTGVITPVAVLEPVLLNGVLVGRTTLHNQEEIQRLDVRVGDTVVIERAGDVIPVVVRVVKEMRPSNAKKFAMPSKCPICKTKVMQVKGEVAVRCPNSACGSQQKNAVIYFASRNNFNIDGLGKKVVGRLIDNGLIKDIADIFVLQKDDVKALEGFEEKSAQNLINAINASKQVSFAKFLSALNIPYIGAETAEYVAQHFKTLKALQNTTEQELQSIHGVGDTVAESLLQWFSEKQNQQLVQRLFDNGVIIKKEEGAQTTLQGKSFVFTGVLDSMGREQAQQKVRSLGGRVSSAVSSQTDFVVYGKGGGSKRTKAEQLGVALISEQEFLTMVQ